MKQEKELRQKDMTPRYIIGEFNSLSLSTEPVRCTAVDSSGCAGKLGRHNVKFLTLMAFKLGFGAQRKRSIVRERETRF